MKRLERIRWSRIKPHVIRGPALAPSIAPLLLFVVSTVWTRRTVNWSKTGSILRDQAATRIEPNSTALLQDKKKKKTKKKREKKEGKKEIYAI